jgi:hypothetical protein
MHSQASIFPSREDLVPTHPNYPSPRVTPKTEWFAAFELKVNGRTRYFTFGDQNLAAQSVECLLAAVPAEFHHLLRSNGHAAGVKISLTLMNDVGLHDSGDSGLDDTLS